MKLEEEKWQPETVDNDRKEGLKGDNPHTLVVNRDRE